MVDKLNDVTLLIVFLAFSGLFLACNKSSIGRVDNTLPISDEYTGYRIELVNIEASEEKGDLVKITGTLINTGRKKVVLPPKSSTNLVINFEDALQNKGLAHLSKKMQYALGRQKLRLEPGQLVQEISFLVKQEPGQSIGSSNEEFVAKGNNVGIDACPDLQIDTFFVSKRTKRYAEISFKIVNSYLIIFFARFLFIT